MKKVFLMATMSLVVLAVSCKKDDDKPAKKSENQSIEGTWYLQKEKSANETDLKEVDDCQKKSHMSFSGKKVRIVTYRQRGKNNCEQSGIQNADLNIEEKVITFLEGGEQVKYTFSSEGNILKVVTENEGIIIYKKR